AGPIPDPGAGLTLDRGARPVGALPVADRLGVPSALVTAAGAWIISHAFWANHAYLHFAEVILVLLGPAAVGDVGSGVCRCACPDDRRGCQHRQGERPTERAAQRPHDASLSAAAVVSDQPSPDAGWPITSISVGNRWSGMPDVLSSF